MSFLPGLLLAVFFSGVIYGGFEDTPWLKDGEYRGAYWPTQAWKSCRPEAVAMDSAKLMLVYPYVANPNFNTRGVVIIRKGYIVAEAYFKGYDRDSSHPCYSVTKSFTGALIGIALGKGILQDVSEPIYAYFPELLKKKGMHIRGRQGYLSPLSPRDLSPGNSPSGAKNRITTRHLLTMTSGIDWNEGDRASLTSDVLNMALQDDFVQYVLDKPMAREPGEHWNYSSGDSMLLSGIIHSALGVSAYEFGREHLFIPIGIPDIRWESDPVGRTIGGWGIEATVRECAKFGYLYSQNGRWEARQIIPAEWVYDSLQPANPDVTFYGYQWWLLPAFSGWEDSIVPRDTHVAIGLFEQQIFVIPSQELVIVRTADDFGSSGWNELEFLTMVLESILE
jgi:CubicO group peptidase (beta-lactamase class C family)